MYEIIYYTTTRGEAPVRDFVESLDRKSYAKVGAFLEYLAEKGPNLHRPYSDHVRGSIRELRVKFAHNSIRVLYFFWHKDRIVLLHGFLKKDMALRVSDIQLAEGRMTDWTARHGK